MTTPHLLRRETHWTCPNCDLTEISNNPQPHSKFHYCRGLRGLWAPMVEDGIRCKVEAKDRDDYVNGDDVQTDGEGRPVMSIKTTRDDGEDLAVLAPCATASTKE